MNTWIISALLLIQNTDHVQILEERYQASEKVAKAYRASKEELRDTKNLVGLADLQATHEEYLKLIEKYPQSPEIYVDFIFFLDRNRKTAEAARVAEEAVQKFPDQVRLLILRDSMKVLASKRSRKEKIGMREELDALFAAWNQILNSKSSSHRASKKKSGVSLGSSE